jgi:hypothetical protein
VCRLVLQRSTTTKTSTPSCDAVIYIETSIPPTPTPLPSKAPRPTPSLLPRLRVMHLPWASSITPGSRCNSLPSPSVPSLSLLSRHLRRPQAPDARISWAVPSLYCPRQFPCWHALLCRGDVATTPFTFLFMPCGVAANRNAPFWCAFSASSRLMPHLLRHCLLLKKVSPLLLLPPW